MNKPDFDPFKFFGFSPSIKTRLIVSFSTAILIPSLLIALAGTYMIKKHVYREAQSKVNSDLEYAKEIYSCSQSQLTDALKIHATRRVFYDALSQGDSPELDEEMVRILSEEKLDFLTLIDENGKVFFSASFTAACF